MGLVVKFIRDSIRTRDIGCSVTCRQPILLSFVTPDLGREPLQRRHNLFTDPSTQVVPFQRCVHPAIRICPDFLCTSFSLARRLFLHGTQPVSRTKVRRYRSRELAPSSRTRHFGGLLRTCSPARSLRLNDVLKLSRKEKPVVIPRPLLSMGLGFGWPDGVTRTDLGI